MGGWQREHAKLIVGGCKVRSSLHPPARILQVYIEALLGSVVHTIQMVSAPRHSLRTMTLEQLHRASSRPSLHSRDRGGSEELGLPGSSLRVNSWSCPVELAPLWRLSLWNWPLPNRQQSLVKHVGSGTRLPELESSFYHLLSVIQLIWASVS